MSARLSPHFTLAEFVRSQTAARRGIPNVPGPAHIRNMERLCRSVLEPLRASVGPIQITSGFRAPDLNAAVGGSRTSQHCFGLAADIACALPPLATCRRIIDLHLPFDQLIFEGTWTHVSVAEHWESPRGQVLTAHFGGGRVRYTQGLPS
jgi:zinc D-Ala-D-Ala carboxypeptidase